MSHVSGDFTVISDEATFEVVGRQGGPAGVLGVSTEAGVEIEIDGADVSQLAAVRVWHDGALSSAQIDVLQELFGDLTPAIVQAFNLPRPVRVGSSRSRLNSLRDDEVSPELTEFVHASDALMRPETPSAVRPLLALHALVSKALGRLPASDILKLNLAELELAVMGVPSRARRQLNELLFQASNLGILEAPFATELANLTFSLQPELSDLALSLNSIVSDSFDLEPHLSLSSSTLRSVTLNQVVRPQLSVDPSGVFSSGTSVRWAEACNLVVTVARPHDPATQWWARARRDSDGCIVAAAPLVESGMGLSAQLLTAESDHLVIDVVGTVSERVLSPNVGALAKAYEAGRTAARLERLGDESAADLAWRECARLHGLAGDFQRQKMALAREFQRRFNVRDSIVDHLL